MRVQVMTSGEEVRSEVQELASGAEIRVQESASNVEAETSAPVKIALAVEPDCLELKDMQAHDQDTRRRDRQLGVRMVFPASP